jgi:hypothetical protein
VHFVRRHLWKLLATSLLAAPLAGCATHGTRAPSEEPCTVRLLCESVDSGATTTVAGSPATRAKKGASVTCALRPSDQAWLSRVLAGWGMIQRDKLKLPEADESPRMILFDSVCDHDVNLGAGSPTWTSEPRDGTTLFPHGRERPRAGVAFTFHDGVGQPTIAMGLPSNWGTYDMGLGLDLDTVMEGVLVHELVHSRQGVILVPRLRELAARYKLPSGIHGDSLQERFQRNLDYLVDYDAERALLLAAARARDVKETRRLATQAVAKMRARRARWFVGADAIWGPLEDLYLSIEGSAELGNYAWLVSGRSLPPEVALQNLRGDGTVWVQDHGLSIFLVIDRLLPDWPKRLFDPNPTLASELLVLATRSAPPR